MKLNLRSVLKVAVAVQLFNAVADVAVWILYGWTVPSWAFGVLIAYTGLITGILLWKLEKVN